MRKQSGSLGRLSFFPLCGLRLLRALTRMIRPAVMTAALVYSIVSA